MSVEFDWSVSGQKHLKETDFDSAVRKIAPLINELREQKTCRSVRKLADKLNELCVPAPNGKLFTYGTMYRVLTRMREFELGCGPSSRSRAAQDRETAYFPRRSSPRRRAAQRRDAAYRSSAHDQ